MNTVLVVPAKQSATWGSLCPSVRHALLLLEPHAFCGILIVQYDHSAHTKRFIRSPNGKHSESRGIDENDNFP